MTRPAFSGLEQRVLARHRALGCSPGATLLLGFSGGADSLALAGMLARLQSRAAFSVLAVHVDHGLRAESDAEQARAAELAAALDVSFVGRRVPGDVRALHPGVGLEEAARRERYRALAEVATEMVAALVALAHHEDDQAETVLLHLMRGAGLVGAAGMRESTTLTVPWWTDMERSAPRQIVLWRPLLAESRSVVRAYAAGLGVAPIEDPSNAERGLRRNAVRHDVLPLLERISPGATAALARFGRLAADDDTALDALAMAALAAAVDAIGAVKRSMLLRQPLAVRRRMVRRWVDGQTGYRALTADRVEAILSLAARPRGGRYVEIGEGHVVVLAGGALRIAAGAGSGLDALSQMATSGTSNEEAGGR